MVEVSRDSLYSNSHTQPRDANTWSPGYRDDEEVLVFDEPEPAHTQRPRQYSAVDEETEQLATYIQRQARRRQRRAWVRKRKGGSKGSPPGREAVRRKCILCVISGTLLTVILTIYLALTLTSDPVPQEVHILGLLGILATTIVFSHSIIRLCMLAQRPAKASSQRRVAGRNGREGFVPEEPIPVYLAQDEEGSEPDLYEAEADILYEEKEATVVKVPPPAYGLWRHSVRANPDFLHWVPARSVSKAAPRAGKGASPVERQATGSTGARPPSYASNDGVAYVVQAVPRSTAPGPGVVQVHPAYRY
ncbi:hypothetical protein H2201_008063 [Coniosporium apollinis]|uniref:Transmembrane protein n=2 Tax=Coniosporium TaxID=2810619 RepID=A0ABQ9NJQ3_9PEZI|nr:hypothetical protein H2199_002413 [Cladosporium sp. JES 115]KAJ9657750.1 hypothetical protein H2201_008063 [Coniosporium apollinis]